MKTIDLSRPFIAIRQDAEGNDYAPTMGEYVCNPLEEDMLDVEVSTGGFYSDEELGVISSVPKDAKPKYTVPAGTAIRFTVSTWDEYQEMVCGWTLRYRTVNLGEQFASFGTFKGLRDVKGMDDVPGLGGRAMVVPREVPG